MKKIIYDIEIFTNFFYLLCKDITEKESKIFAFEISPVKDERKELLTFLSDKKKIMIGFNTLKFDWPLLNHFEDLMKKYPLMYTDILTNNLKNKANNLINSSFVHANNKIIQLDLLKINHYDNKAKMISLKGLEFSMRMNNVQELPYAHDKVLELNEIDVVKGYCVNDINATYELFLRTKTLIDDRFKSSYLYKTNLLNYNNPKLGEYILIKRIKEHLNKEDLGQTYRKEIILKDIIFPYITFEHEPFKNILNWFNKKIIKETKSVFTEIPLEEIEELKPNINIKIFKKTNLKKLNVVHKGFEFTFGTGGIHGAEKGIYYSDENYKIMSFDVKSLYPNISIRNNLFPLHLGNTFCEIYEDIYNERLKYPKSDSRNELYKLALNGAYGKSNSIHSSLYDPQFTMSINKMVDNKCG
jgi:DNA polymerase elongation subunit (family B)